MASKIINISLQRSATKSFCKFSEKKGFKTLHGLDAYSDVESKEIQENISKTTIKNSFFNLIEKNKYEVIADTPSSYLIEEFFKEYPDELYVLIIRSPESWAKSAKWLHTWLIEEKKFYAVDNYMYANFFAPLSGIEPKFISDYTIQDYIKIYKSFCSYAVNLASKQNISLSVLSLNDVGNLEITLNKLYNKIQYSNYEKYPKVQEKFKNNN